jgi:hypothetical protein
MRLRRDIEIAAPIERVFEFIDDPGNYPALRPQIVRVLDTQRLPHGGREVRHLLHRFGRLYLLEVGMYWEQRQRLQRYLQAVKTGVEQAVSG